MAAVRTLETYYHANHLPNACAILTNGTAYDSIQENHPCLAERFDMQMIPNLPVLRGSGSGPRTVKAMIFQLGQENVQYNDPTQFHETSSANPVIKMIFNICEKTTAGDAFENLHKNPDKFVKEAVGRAYFNDDKLNSGPIRIISG